MSLFTRYIIPIGRMIIIISLPLILIAALGGYLYHTNQISGKTLGISVGVIALLATCVHSGPEFFNNKVAQWWQIKAPKPTHKDLVRSKAPKLA